MTIVFTTSNRWLSRLIRWVTRAEVSHVALYAGKFIVHADVGGVQVESSRAFFAKNRLVEAYREDRCTKTCVTHALDMVGARYDYRGFVRIGLARLGVAFRRPLASPRALVCSELVARTIPAFLVFDPENVTPQELLDHCRKDPTMVRLS